MALSLKNLDNNKLSNALSNFLHHRLTQPIAIFFASFSLAFICGSLAFVVRDSNAAQPPAPNAPPSLSMSVSPTNLDFSLTPSITGSVATADITASITTDNPTGYNVLLNTETTNTDLTHSNGTTTIPSSANGALASLSANTWGYNASSSTTDFLAIPAPSSPGTIASSNTTASSTPHTATIGANVDTTKHAGTYSNDLVITTVAKLLPVPNLTALNPAAGPLSGGTTITFTGTDLSYTSVVLIDGNICTNLSILSDTSMTCDSPAGASYGAKPVSIESYGSPYATSLTFEYAKPEEFKFSVDTRMTDTLDTDPTHYSGTATTFYIPTSGYVGGTDSHSYDWLVDCGNGAGEQNYTGTSSASGNGIACNYATPGEYQISIKSNGAATTGWMDAFGFYSNTSGNANKNTNKLLFKSIDTSFPKNARTLDSGSTFAYTFYGARNATTIPAGLFGSIDTSGATDLSSMFSATFSSYASNSTSGTIPAGLFGSIDTSGATNLSDMFNTTFSYYARNSTSGTIPTGLFDSIDTSGATDLSSMFKYTFSSYAHANKTGDSTPDTDINNIWGSADLSGITASNAGGSSGVFYQTFYNMPSLTGSAQTFINNYLGGINPSSDTDAFYDTGVTDLASLHANWK